MSLIPQALILRGPGTNCDQETSWALELAGSGFTSRHINRLIENPSLMHDFQMLVLPGGFTYGDDISAGAVMALEIREKLGSDLKTFIKAGKLVVGICNGFQILIKSGFLPGNDFAQKTTLFSNDSAKYECRWIYLKKNPKNNSPFLAKLPEIFHCPVAHAEGKFIVSNKKILDSLSKNNQVAFQYVDAEGNPGEYPVNPNGSIDGIAGITDPTGRVFGLMPHPERNIFKSQHPGFRRGNTPGDGAGLRFFEGAVEYIKKEL